MVWITWGLLLMCMGATVWGIRWLSKVFVIVGGLADELTGRKSQFDRIEMDQQETRSLLVAGDNRNHKRIRSAEKSCQDRYEILFKEINKLKVADETQLSGIRLVLAMMYSIEEAVSDLEHWQKTGTPKKRASGA